MTEKQWEACPLNSSPDANAALCFPPTVAVSDCTLREGEQQVGVVLSTADKIALAHALDDLGVQEIEAGMPVVSAEETKTVAAIAAEGLRAKLTAVVRSRREEVDLARRCGVTGVTLSIPFGRLQVEHKLKWSYEKIHKTVQELATYAKDQGLYVIVSPYDTTRADLGRLDQFLASLAAAECADRVRMVDTVGSASPQAVAYLVRLMIEASDLPVEVHCHNDFGLATANTLAGLGAGASVASTTVNGMGERSGAAATEEVALALLVLYGIDTGLDYSRFFEVSQLVQSLTGVSVQPHKAVVGENAFAQEAGLVVGGLIQSAFTAQAMAPELVGQQMRLVLGKKSGHASIKLALEQLGLEGSETDVEALLASVKELSQKEKRPVSAGEFARLATEMIGGEAQ